MYKILIALISICSLAAVGQGKSQPDSMVVGKYQALREKYQGEFELLAEKAPRVVELKKEIDFLKRPLKLNDTITIRTKDYRGRPIEKSGKLYKVTPSVVTLNGINDYKKKYVNTLDWLWLQRINNPAVVKQAIVDRQADVGKQKKIFVSTRTEQKLIDEGYNKGFLSDAIPLGPNFVLKKELGEGTLSVKALRYSGSEHMKNFIELEIAYKGSDELAGVLLVEYPAGSGKEVALCTFGKESASGKINGKKFKKIKFFFNREELTKHIGSRWDRALRKSRLLLMKRLHGSWVLATPKYRPERSSSNVPCADCWGRGKVDPVGSIDVSEYAKEKLDKAKAKDVIRKKGQDIISKYKNPQDKEAFQCPKCGGSGDDEKKSKMRGIRLTYRLDPTSVKAYSADEYKIFEKLYKSVPTFGDVEAIKQQFSKKYKDERINNATEEAHAEVDALVAEFTKMYKKRAYDLLEKRFRGGWLRRDEILAKKKPRSPGVGNVQFAEKERAGYAPKNLYDKKVRRFTDWRLLRSFKKLGGLKQRYDLSQVYYRIVEIGGADIDLDLVPKGKGAVEEGIPGRRNAAHNDLPGMDEDMMDPDRLRSMPPPPNKRANSRRLDDDRSRRNRREDGVNEEDANEEEGGVKNLPNDNIPGDIPEREYVIQYAAFFRSDNKPFSVATDFQIQITPEVEVGQEVNFDLPAKDRRVKATHSFTIAPGWSGWLIGSKKMTFDQMIGRYDDKKTITFKAVVK